MDKKAKTVGEASAKDTKSTFVNRQLSAYYWRLEQLLNRIECSSTHYQVLDLSRSATNEQISHAYRQTLTVLHPANQSSGFAMPGDIQRRIKRALKKISLAGSILLNFGKRVEYDNSLSRRPTAPLTASIFAPPRLERPNARPIATPNQEKPQPQEQEENPSLLAGDPKTVLPEEPPHLQPIATQPPIKIALVNEKSEENRRRGRRFKLSIPVYVTGHDRDKGKSREVANTVNVSRFGAAIEMCTRVPQGTVLHLTLPLPVKLRNHGHADHSYNVFAIVRRVQPPKDGVRLVGVEFLGEHPPEGYLEQPWGTFHTTTKWQGANRRREPRERHTESVGVEYLDKDMQPIQSEIAVTEDVSRSGMRIFVSATPDEFDYVKITNLEKNCSRVAALCNRYVGKDGFERLCLNFIDVKWSL